MKRYPINRFFPLLFALLFVVAGSVQSQSRDNLPAEYREYTNPEEVVAFDRTTSFSRAVDVINDFSQKYRDKMVINQAATEGDIGISVPAMHWYDALELILRVNDLMLQEQQKYFEIVTVESQQASTQSKTDDQGTQTEGEEGPAATTNTHEVRINAIFFEGNRRALQEVGVDWSTLSENVPEGIVGGEQGGGGQGGQGGQGGGQVPSSEFDGPFVQVDSKGASNVSEDVFSALVNVGEIGNSGIDVQALFSAFEADNLGETLASPTIKVVDGQEGRIQVGQDFSIKQRDVAGNVVEEFFSVGTILEVTPQVLTQNDTTFVHLDINAERSTAQPDPVSTIINKTQAETEALLLDGETTVLAGLYSTEDSEVRRGVPILKDLPPWFFGLRYLFGYTSNDSQMRELVVLLEASLEPRIPERLSKDQLRSKYEVMRDERQRIRDEVNESQQAKDSEPIYDIEDIKSEDSEADDEQKNQQSEEPEKPATSADSAENEQKVNREKENKEEAPAIADPEVRTKKVELNLSGEESTKNSSGVDSTVTESADTSGSNKPENSGEAEQKDSSDSNSYYLIGGSFSQAANATNLRKALIEEGYNATVIEKESSDLIHVAYGGYQDLEQARIALAEIQQQQNEDAWLYRND